MHSLAAVFITLLPERYRKCWKWVGLDSSGACLSGVLELVLSLSFLVIRFMAYATHRTTEALPLFSGPLLYLIYLTQPLSMILIFFTIEGAIRGLAGGVGNQIMCSLPFKIMAMIHGKVEQIRHEKRLGGLLPDDVQRGGTDGYDLIVSSCRPKPGWHYHLNTVSYEHELFEIVGERTGVAPRRFVYLLRKFPANKMVRGIQHYDPNDVMIKKPGGLKTFAHVMSKVFHQATTDANEWRERQ